MRNAGITTALALSLCAGAAALSGCNGPSGAAGEKPKAVRETSAPPPKAATGAPAVEDGVVVYYFHGNRRCPTCRGMQATIEQTVEERFAAEIAAGKLAFEEVNFEEEANGSYVERYRLASSTMVVSTVRAGKEASYVNCEKVWEHAHDPAALADYAAEQIRAALAAL